MLRGLVKSVVPAAMIHRYRRALLRRKRKLNAGRPLRVVFEDIYGRGDWGGNSDEWCSGSGSTSEQTNGYVTAVAAFVQQQGIRSLVDVGCGDFRVGAALAALGIDYTGVDIVAELVERNNRLFASEQVRFVSIDITREPPPDGDLALVRQVFQHLSNAEIAAAISHLERFRYLLVTEHHPTPGRFVSPNVDKPHGGCTRIVDGSAVCLDQPPFERSVRLLCEAPVLEPMVTAGETLRTYLVTNPAFAE